jgi:hypothetical protein
MDWFKNLSTASKVMVIGVAVLTLFVIILLPVAILTHHEAGFADAHTPISEGFLAPDYPHLPIGVCVASYAAAVATAEDERAVREAAGITNDRVGFALFDVGNTATYTHGCSIIVTIGVPQDSAHWRDPGGGAARCSDGCCIETSNTGTSELTSLALQHELGHCLGLAHDDYPMSIMYPEQHPTPDGQFPPRISDSDRSLLISHYH